MESSNECNRIGISCIEINFHQSTFVIGACLLKWHNHPIIRCMPCAAQCFSFHCFSRYRPLFSSHPKNLSNFYLCSNEVILWGFLAVFVFEFHHFCLLDLIISSKTTWNGWFRKLDVHEKHTGRKERIVPKCTAALLIPAFFSLLILQETLTYILINFNLNYVN